MSLIRPQLTSTPANEELFQLPLLIIQAFKAQAEAPARVPDAAAPAVAVLQPSQVELLKSFKGPLVKITAHYHVNFGDSLKVIGSSEEFGAWTAAGAPSMTWGEGDVWTLVVPLGPGEHEFKVRLLQLAYSVQVFSCVLQHACMVLKWMTGSHSWYGCCPCTGRQGRHCPQVHWVICRPASSVLS